jgi:uncharacterized protein (DUF2141 family)
MPEKTALVGVPTEDYGLSNNPRRKMRPAALEKAKSQLVPIES